MKKNLVNNKKETYLHVAKITSQCNVKETNVINITCSSLLVFYLPIVMITNVQSPMHSIELPIYLLFSFRVVITVVL